MLVSGMSLAASQDDKTTSSDDATDQSVLGPQKVSRRLLTPRQQRIAELEAEIEMTKKQAEEMGMFVKQAAILTGSIITIAKATGICGLVSPLAVVSLSLLSMVIITFMILKLLEYGLERNLIREKSTVNRIHTSQFFYHDIEQSERVGFQLV